VNSSTVGPAVPAFSCGTPLLRHAESGPGRSSGSRGPPRAFPDPADPGGELCCGVTPDTAAASGSGTSASRNAVRVSKARPVGRPSGFEHYRRACRKRVGARARPAALGPQPNPIHVDVVPELVAAVGQPGAASPALAQRADQPRQLRGSPLPIKLPSTSCRMSHRTSITGRAWPALTFPAVSAVLLACSEVLFSKISPEAPA